MFGVQPEADERFAGERFRLRDFVFVMGKRQVDAAGVDVERFAQVLHRHHGALDVPAGTAGAERRFPGGFAVLLRFPENEVAGVGFVVFVDVDAGAGADAARNRCARACRRSENSRCGSRRNRRSNRCIRASPSFSMAAAMSSMWSVALTTALGLFQAQRGDVVEERLRVDGGVLGDASYVRRRRCG